MPTTARATIHFRLPLSPIISSIVLRCATRMSTATENCVAQRHQMRRNEFTRPPVSDTNSDISEKKNADTASSVKPSHRCQNVGRGAAASAAVMTGVMGGQRGGLHQDGLMLQAVFTVDGDGRPPDEATDAAGRRVHRVLHVLVRVTLRRGGGEGGRGRGALSTMVGNEGGCGWGSGGNSGGAAQFVRLFCQCRGGGGCRVEELMELIGEFAIQLRGSGVLQDLVLVVLQRDDLLVMDTVGVGGGQRVTVPLTE